MNEYIKRSSSSSNSCDYMHVIGICYLQVRRCAELATGGGDSTYRAVTDRNLTS
jgi:hypothetical protein